MGGVEVTKNGRGMGAKSIFVTFTFAPFPFPTIEGVTSFEEVRVTGI
jgi:hypothetical protein